MDRILRRIVRKAEAHPSVGKRIKSHVEQMAKAQPGRIEALSKVRRTSLLTAKQAQRELALRIVYKVLGADGVAEASKPMVYKVSGAKVPPRRK